MSEINVYDRNKQLNDIQTTYEKKKRELRSKGESELSELRDQYKQKMEKERSSGDAVINHIQKNKSVQTEQIMAQNKESVQHSQELLAKNIKGLQEDQKQQQEKLQQARLEASAVHDREVKALEVQSQTGRESLEEMQDKVTREIAHTQRKYNQEINQTQIENKERLQEIKQQTSKQIDHQINVANEEQKRINLQHEANVRKLREEAQKALNQEQSISKNDLQTEKQTHQQRMGALQAEYKKQSDRIEMENQKLFGNRKLQYEKEKAMREENIRKDMALQTKKHETRVQELRNNMNQDVVVAQKQFEGRIEKMRQDFNRVYNQTNDVNRTTLDNQRENIIRAIANQRKELLSKTKNYEDMKADPFYSIVDYDSNLEEFENGYIFSTRIPKIEKPNITVRVHEDKVVLSGARTFNDTSDLENKKLATASHQTFHEEFKLDRPVDAKKVAQFYDEEILSVYIPKK